MFIGCETDHGGEALPSEPDDGAAEVVEAADLGELGAMAALIDLKLSGHSQFGDKPGGCKLAAQAAARGDAHAAARLKDCS